MIHPTMRMTIAPTTEGSALTNAAMVLSTGLSFVKRTSS